MGKLSRGKKQALNKELDELRMLKILYTTDPPTEPGPLRKFHHRVCELCPPDAGCNIDFRREVMVDGFAEYWIRRYHAHQILPAGLHIKIMDVYRNDLNERENPNTLMKYQVGDVVKVKEAFNRHHYPQVKGAEHFVYGPVGYSWVPTLDPVTTATEEFKKFMADWKQAILENEVWVREQKRKREQVYLDNIRHGEVHYVPADGMPVADFTKGESYMRSSTGRKFLDVSGACEFPLRYVGAFPPDMPVAEIWHEHLFKNKKSPMGEGVRWYWVTTIIGYVPGLMKEALKRVKELMQAEGTWEQYRAARHQTDYIDGNEDGHFNNEAYRNAFARCLPWPELEFRLRQQHELDKGKDPNGWRVYNVTKHEAELGVVTNPEYVFKEVEKKVVEPQMINIEMKQEPIPAHIADAQMQVMEGELF